MSTRERILDAALDLFAAEGLGGTTVTEIERRAGLTPGRGSLYRHFRSKDDVFEATIVREVERLKAVVEQERAELPQLPDRRSQLTLDYHQCLRDVQRFDSLLRVLAREQGRVGKVHEILGRVLAVDDQVDSLTSAVVVAALLGYHHLSQFQRKPFHDIDPTTFITKLVDLTM
jgi:AcrR family transcriptional regulator